MTRYRPLTEEKKRVLKQGFIEPEKRARNIVAAFLEAMRKKAGPYYNVISYKPISAAHIRVTCTAPVWNNEPQKAVISRYTMGLPSDDVETWSARWWPNGEGELVRFEIDALTGEFVKVY